MPCVNQISTILLRAAPSNAEIACHSASASYTMSTFVVHE